MRAGCDLLVLDLDGTLLDARGRISARNVDAVHAIEAAGTPVVIATGRSWHESRRAIEPLGYDRPMVTAGGAVLCDGASGHSLRRHEIPAPLVGDVVETLLRHEHAALLLKDTPPEQDHYVVVGDRPLAPASSWWFDTFEIRYQRIERLSEDPHPEETVRVGVVAEQATVALVAEELRDALGHRVFLQHWAAVTETSAFGGATHLLEIFNPRVNKWSMVEELCGQLEIDPARVAAIGDGLNDVELIEGAGLGIAMANACAGVMDAAAATTGHHDADGVAEAIDALLTGRLRVPPAD